MSIKTADTENFNELIQGDFTIIDVYSTTCTPCKIFAGILEDVSLDLPFLNIVKVNISNDPLIGEEYKIEAVPTIIFAKDGKEVARDVGLMDEKELLENISRYYYGVEPC